MYSFLKGFQLPKIVSDLGVYLHDHGLAFTIVVDVAAVFIIVIIIIIITIIIIIIIIILS